MRRWACIRVVGLMSAAILGVIATPALATFSGSTTGKYAYSDFDPRQLPCTPCSGQRAIVVGKTQITFPVLGAVPPALAESHSSPAYSPDGSKIAFVREGGPYAHPYAIVVMDESGANPTEIVDAGDVNAVIVGWGEPAQPNPKFEGVTWTADGQKVVFGVAISSAWALGGIWAVRLDGTGHARLVGTGATDFKRIDSPEWAPYGAKLAYRCSGRTATNRFDLCVNDTAEAGERVIPIDSPTGSSFWSVGRPEWTPDGSRLLFHISYTSLDVISYWGPLGGFSSSPYGKSELFSVRSDGSGLKQLTDSFGMAGLGRSGYVPVASLELYDPVMSPDGASIIAEGHEFDPGFGHYLLGASGGSAKRLYTYTGNVLGGGPVDWQPKTEGLTILVEDGHGHPLSSLGLELLTPERVLVDANPTVQLGGRYRFAAVAPGNYLARAKLQDAKVGPSFKIFHDLEEETTWIEREIVVESGSGESIVVPFDDSAGLHDTNVDAPFRHRLDDLAFLYYRLHQYVDWIKDNVTPTTGRPVAVRAFFSAIPGGQPYPPDGARYLGTVDELSGVILLGTQFSEYESRDGLAGPTGVPDDAPDNGEWHEFNHHLYGEFVQGDPCVGTNHGGYSNPDTCDSMDEGFAAFLALRAAQSIEGTDSTFYAGRFDLEAGGFKAWSTGVDRDGVLRSREDAAVASLFWDLVDPLGDGESTEVVHENGSHVPVNYVDYEQFSLQELWLTLTTLQPNTVMELRQALGSPELSVNLDNYGFLDIAWVDQVFLMQGFFPIDAEQGISGHSGYHYDVARAQRINPALPRNASVGQSDHVVTDATGIVFDTFIPRSHFEATPGANIAVQVQDASGTPLAGARIDLDLQYPVPPSQLPYPRTVRHELTTGETSLIPLELPPGFSTLPPVGSPAPPCSAGTEGVVTVSLRAELNGYTSSTPPSFDNCTYRNAVEAAVGDAAMSFTLTFPEDSTEPATTVWKETNGIARGNGTNGFWQVELDCSDPVTGGFASGCHRTEYRLDGGPLSAFSKILRVDDPGVHLIEYRSIDSAGNAHPFRTQVLGVGVDPDSDGDGLSDGTEIDLGTAFEDPDSDDDGLLDGAERTAGTGPLDPDSDDDGLLDGAEVNSIGSNPLDRDSDDDRLEDAIEVAGGTSPILADTDGDGLSDRAEIATETDPIAFDSDGDSVADGSDDCPLLANPDQRNRDADPYGDVCDFEDRYTTWQLIGVTGDGGSSPESLFRIDTANASTTFLKALGNGDDGEAIAFDPEDGRLYHASGRRDRVWESIDPVTLTIVSSGPFAGPGARELAAMTYRPMTTKLFVADQSGQLFAVMDTGAATFVGSLVNSMKGLAFVGGALYGATAFSNDLHEIDVIDGSTISSVPVTLNGVPVTGMNGLARHPVTGALWAVLRVSGTRYLGTIDVATGVASSVGVLSDNFAGITFLPEPSNLTGLGSGIVALVLGALRRRRVSRSH